MERKIISFLQKWQKDIIRKPLILYGPKQVGKSYSALEFGNRNYKNTIYFNTTNNKTIEELFKKEKSTDRLILNLSLLSKETILPEDTLLIFDNVNSIEIVKGLKLFGSERSKYHIIAITSRRENLMEFKGEELQFKGMNEMDFEEFLWACHQKEVAEKIRYAFDNQKSCAVHTKALSLFYDYLLTGGLPEVVCSYVNGEAIAYQRSIQERIFDLYKAELTRTQNLIDIPRGIEVVDSICQQLYKDNKKFQYGLLGFGKRAKEYESVIQYLVSNQLLYRSYKITTIKSPLSSCREIDSFKLYYPDDGLLSCRYHLTKQKLLADENIKLALYENHIAHTLMEAGYSLYYYQSEGKAEVNFVIQNRMGRVIPIEIATKTGSKVKSLSVFMKRYPVEDAYRITENNFTNRKGVHYLPIYAIFCLNNLIY